MFFLFRSVSFAGFWSSMPLLSLIIGSRDSMKSEKGYESKLKS